MKKLIVFMLVLTMTFMSLAACGTGGENGGDTTKGPAATEEPGTGETTEGTKKAETTKAATTKAVTTAEVTEPPIPLPTVPMGAMVYYENFDFYPNTAANEDTMNLIGWKIRNLADGALSDNTGVYTIKDGTLYASNYDGGSIAGVDSYVEILDGDYMISCCQGDYTLEYDVKYVAASATDRYMVIVLNYDGYNSYNSFHVRARGSANNQVRYVGGWQTYDIAGDFYAADTNDTDGTTTVVKKLLGLDYDATAMPFLDKWITIRYQASYEGGPTIYLRDNSQANPQFICVSKADTTAAGFTYWGLIEAYGVALKLGGKIDGYLDNIAIWTGLGEIPTNTSTADYESAIAPYLAEVAKKG